MKKRKKLGIAIFWTGIIMLVFCLVGMTGFAAETDGGISGEGFSSGMAYIGAALSTGIAAIGGGIAVGAGAPAAIGALTEDPKSFGKALIFVAMGEGIALYGMLIAIIILNKV